MTDEITSFKGAHRFLSNFWPATVSLDGVTYPTVEHAYVAAKTLDPSIRAKVSAAKSAGEAKRIGRQIQLRFDWDEVKLDVMEDLVRQKFRNRDLALALLDTGNARLVEGNTWGDTFWGVCNGVGQNNLGKILMKIRQEIRGSHD